MNKLMLELLTAVQNLFETFSTKDLLTGGLWYERVPPDSQLPYCVITATGGEKTNTSTYDYLQIFTITFTLYALGGIGKNTIAPLATLLDEFNFCEGELSLASGRVVAFVPSGNIITIEPELINSEDVTKITASFLVTLQGRSI